VHVRLSNGSSFFVSADFADSAGLRPGIDVTAELEKALIADDERLAAYNKGLELLGRREHTALELERKLKQRGFGEDTVARTLECLKRAGYLDDRRFAAAWVEYRLKRRPEGYPRLAAGLARHGVARAVIEAVLKEMFTEDESEQALARAAAKILNKGAVDELSALRYLTGKGFPYRQAKAHLQKLQSSG